MPVSDAQAWIKRETEARRKFEEGMDRLSTLNIVRIKGAKYQLNGVFRDGMRRALIGGGDHRSFGVACDTPDKNAVDLEYLDEYARSRWEAILHYMVGSGGAEVPRAPVLYLLRASGLMQHASSKRPDDADLSITSLGFQFLLEDLNTQLWDLLLSYLTMAESRNMDLVEVLSFIFMLGNLQLGKDYSIEDFTETQLHMLQDFRDYGLVYQRKSTSRRFYPTRLATTLTSSATPLVGGHGSDEERGFVILETNYRVYAYTNNPLRISVLSLFVSLKARFPNLIMGTINRESVKAALSNGISSDQIIAYLTHHAHGQMLKNDPVLPVTVTDQIRLWEREKNRVTTSPGSLFADFSSFADFAMVRDYASQLGVLLWQNEQKRLFFVAAEGDEPTRDFIRRRLQN
ncbi:transcription factor tfb2 [Ceraceosorus bombacis]|uniref:RNA polymerase II transcription factor B subunit 2 n=1 Tax=Ceraceosorus bombacis TaxID=401625 RepID=A0A0P1BDM2_9BASI|nr:transcription factor tfb2 [Ceraceosorus bombacis]